METEKILNKIFAELTKKAYDYETHTYNYKFTNQVIRANIEALMQAKVFSSNAVLAVTSDSKENKNESEVALPKKSGTNCRECTARLEEDNIYGICADCYFLGNER